MPIVAKKIKIMQKQKKLLLASILPIYFITFIAYSRNYWANDVACYSLEQSRK